jgi:hypothetical protein
MMRPNNLKFSSVAARKWSWYILGNKKWELFSVVIVMVMEISISLSFLLQTAEPVMYCTSWHSMITVFACAQLLQNWCEQQIQKWDKRDMSIIGGVGRVCYIGVDLFLISFLYCCTWLFLGCILNVCSVLFIFYSTYSDRLFSAGFVLQLRCELAMTHIRVNNFKFSLISARKYS